MDLLDQHDIFAEPRKHGFDPWKFFIQAEWARPALNLDPSEIAADWALRDLDRDPRQEHDA